MWTSPSAECVRRPSAARPLGLLVLALCALRVIAAPPAAAAWTDASVRSVKATVTVAADGAAHVALRVAVHVHGGWLEGLELEGLDPALVLDPTTPPLVTGEDGAVYVPATTVRADGGESTRVQLSFPRRAAPRRGRYELTLVYTTSLAHRATAASSDGASVRVRWTLPPWQTGLDGVELTLDVPGAARPAAELGEESDALAARVTVAARGARTQITWRRPHLPRTTVWTIAADVPSADLAPALRRLRASTPGVAARPSTVPAWPAALALALVLLALGALTARARATALRRARLGTAPLVPMPRALRVLVCLALVGAAPLVAGAHAALAVLPLVALLALSLVRTGPDLDARARAHVAERLVVRTDLRNAARATLRARLLTLDALLDATTLPGALAALALLLLARRAYPLVGSGAAPLLALGAALATVPFFALTRASRRRSPAEALDLLRRTASRLRIAADAPAALGLSITVRGAELVSARLRVVPADAPDGLRSLEVVLAERAYGSVVATERALRATTRHGSDADRALATTLDALDGTVTRDATHTTRLVSLAALDDALRALAAAAATAAALIDADQERGDDASLDALLFDELDASVRERGAPQGNAASSARSARRAD